MAEVKQEERRRAFKLFSVERQRVLDTVAFGRRALPPPTGRKVTNSITKPVGKLRFSSLTSLQLFKIHEMYLKDCFNVTGQHGSGKRCTESVSK